MCDKFQRRAALSKNLVVSIYWEYAIGVQRKEIYSIIFEIKRVQFFIAVKHLVIDKADYYCFGSCPNIVLSIDSSTTLTYIVNVLTSTLVRRYLAVVLLTHSSVRVAYLDLFLFFL